MAEYLTKTYALQSDGERISVRGYTDGLEALRQAIYLMLQVERGEYAIFSEDYGLAAADLLGKSYPYLAAELERRIKECLLADERILAVEDVTFTAKGGRLSGCFVVKSIYGESEESVEVSL